MRLHLHLHRWTYPPFDFKMRRFCECGKTQRMGFTRLGWRWR